MLDSQRPITTRGPFETRARLQRLPSRVRALTMPQVRSTTLFMTGVPSAFDGLRILQISDVHAGPYMPVDRMARIRDLALSTTPDLVVFTGDQLDRRPSDAARFVEGFGSLHAPLGVYGILGNHDHMVGAPLAETALREAGVTPLVNRSVELEREGWRVALVGVDDLQSTVDAPRFSLLERHRAAFRICLCHQPRGWHDALAAGAHLTLSGHTHGGQIALNTRNLNVARLQSRYISGLYRRHDDYLWVSRGIGVGAVPIRFGAPPELDLITLRRSATSTARAAA